MSKNFFTVMLAALSISTAVFASPELCVDADKSPTVQVTGTIKIVKFEHPSNGSLLTAYMLELDQPVCYTKSSIENGAKIAMQDSEIQVTGNTTTLMDGTRVKLSGNLTADNISAYYLSETAIQIK